MHEMRMTMTDGLKAKVAAFERQLIESALLAEGGNQRRAAASLGLLPTTLHEKMKRLGLLRREYGSALAVIQELTEDRAAS
jgi:DNA-binding NtrC family response regulator